MSPKASSTTNEDVNTCARFEIGRTEFDVCRLIEAVEDSDIPARVARRIVAILGKMGSQN